MPIDHLKLIGERGEVVPASATSDERKKLFPPLGIVKAVSLRWNNGHGEVELPIEVGGDKYAWEILPDRSGICITNKAKNAQSRAVILDDDGRTRFLVQNPWPRSNCYSPLDEFGFSYPTVEGGRLGAVVWVWSPIGERSGVAVEHFYELDDKTGVFGANHPIK